MSRCCDSKRIQWLNGRSYPLRQKRATGDTYFSSSRQAGSHRTRLGSGHPAYPDASRPDRGIALSLQRDSEFPLRRCPPLLELKKGGCYRKASITIYF